MHRQYSFLPGSLKRFIRKYEITFDYLKVHPGMICRPEKTIDSCFILTLRRPGKILKTPYSQGPAVRELPTIEGTLQGLGQDALLYMTEGSAEEFGSTFGMEPDEAEKSWETLKYIHGKLQEFLGPEGFEEFVNMAVKGFEMGASFGEREWRKPKICG